MLFKAKNHQLPIGDTYMDYVTFGKGCEVLVILPGLSDGIKTVKNMALPLALMYSKFAKKYRVYIPSRKHQFPDDYSIEKMADDMELALRKLEIHQAHILGISQGGMIAQLLAIKYPKLVSKLVLAVTVARQNDTIQTVVKNWITLAKAGDYKGIVIDTAEKSYSPERLRKYRKLIPLLTRFGKPKDFSRFIIQANACLNHDAYDRLKQIKCQTLIIGGGRDAIVGNQAAQEMASQITDAEIFVYERYSHAAYEEAKDIQTRIINFLSR